MALTLYDNVDSSNALKVRFLLAELGLDAELVDVPLDAVRPAWYLELHPFGTIPCLVDGELAITESNAILRYLSRREGRDDLYPADPALAARIDLLLDALSLQLRPLLWAVEEPIQHGGRRADPAAVRELEAGLVAWERLLAANGELLERFTIADIGIAGRLAKVHALPIAPDNIPLTSRVLERALERPAFARALRGDSFRSTSRG